ncbi:hypothetical protein ACGFYP_34505 [Streptomyces sp. NPDC048370]
MYVIAFVVTMLVAGGVALLAYVRPKTAVPLTISIAVVAIAAMVLNPGS